MKFATRFWFSVVLVVVLVPFLNAQQRTASSAAATTLAVSESNAPDFCPHLFSAGSGNNYLRYCVTDNGNITLIETPLGHSHMGTNGEGYGLCQESPAVEYHDYAVSDSGNWQPSQIVSLTKSLIKISRTTSDGRWTLVQTISKVAATGSIKVVMALTNNARSDQVAYLLRFADIDPDGKVSGSLATASLQSAGAIAVIADTPHYGLQLLSLGKSPFGYQQGFVLSADTLPNACDFASGIDLQGFSFGEGHPGYNPMVEYVYAGAVPAGQTLTVTMNYRGT